MEEKLKQAMATALQVDLNQITASATPQNIPSWDSAAHVRLIMQLEQQFKIQFDDEEVAELISFEAILNAIKRYSA